MLVQVLLVAHIAVLGYWLGAELVINSTYRYVCFSAGMQYSERQRLMDHVRCTDQHVRYALVLQAGLGAALAFLTGYLPGGEAAAIIAGLLAAVWLAYVEVVHRLRFSPGYTRLALIDRSTRYGLMAALVVIWGAAIAGSLPLTPWLAWKLLCFAGVMACGVGIRLQGIRMFRAWSDLEEHGSSADREAVVQKICIRATSILVGLWLFIAAIVMFSVWKPGG